MTTPMDRGFGSDPFRRMEREKLRRKVGLLVSDEDARDIEAPILPQDGE